MISVKRDAQIEFDKLQKKGIQLVLNKNGKEFVTAAYLFVLKRMPDEVGLIENIEKLTNYKKTKIEILYQLAISKEAKKINVFFPAILWRFYLFKIPVLGKIFRYFNLLSDRISLSNSRIENLQEEVSVLDTKTDRLNANVNDLIVSIENMKIDSNKSLDNLNNDFRLTFENLNNDFRKSLISFERKSSKIVNQNLDQLKDFVYNATSPPRLSNELYLNLEEQLRGSREEIIKRLGFYIDFLPAKESHPHILDLGCGRGEWLEVLNGLGFSSVGIDENSVMVRNCTDRGLHAIHGDALNHISELEPYSLDLITAFHLIEHLTLPALTKLFENAHKALKNGGMLFIETPNPENLTVGAYTFHFDPSHQKPIPPILAQFYAENLGFSNAEIYRLHPRKEIGDEDEFKNNWFCKGVDYALICKKE
tara:strand:- start:13964 stop:15229 length:1266 start_codon:yes stop_codon:yes gene_type:complete